MGAGIQTLAYTHSANRKLVFVVTKFNYCMGIQGHFSMYVSGLVEHVQDHSEQHNEVYLLFESSGPRIE